MIPLKLRFALLAALLFAGCSGSGSKGSGIVCGAVGMDPFYASDGGRVDCDFVWQQCSDGKTYEVACPPAAGQAHVCQCSVNGALQSSFSTGACFGPEQGTPVANAGCSWQLVLR